MTESRALLERELERLSPRRIPVDQLARRRDRKRQSQRIGAAIVGVAVSLLAIGSLIRVLGEADRTGRPSPTPSPTAEPAFGEGVLSLVDVSTGRARPLRGPITLLSEAGGFELSPDGRSLAFQARVTAGGVHQIFVSDADGSNVRQVTTDAAVEPRNPSWSPDGTRLVYEGRTSPTDGDRDDDLFVLDVASRVSRRLHLALRAVPYLDVHTPSFGQDGLTIVYTAFDEERDTINLYSIPIDGGKSTLLKRKAAFASVSPDGQTIAYREALMIPGIGTAVSLMTIDGERLPAPGGSDAVMGSLLEVDPGAVPSWSPSGRRIAYTDPAVHSIRRMSVFDLDSGDTTVMGRGTEVAWLDDDTLIVRAFQPRRG